MQRAGDVVKTAQGVAVVRAESDEHPDIGTTVVDQNLDAVGRVVDVFGPVARPYLAVSPNSEVHLPRLVGQTLYVR
jgi:RNA-binding protein